MPICWSSLQVATFSVMLEIYSAKIEDKEGGIGSLRRKDKIWDNHPEE